MPPTQANLQQRRQATKPASTSSTTATRTTTAPAPRSGGSSARATGAAGARTTGGSQINVKILLIGNSSVGKTSLLSRFSDEQWIPEDESSATIGVDFKVHQMEVKGKKVKLSIWDTAGQERFRAITASYYRGAQGIILVYDVANRETFDALPRWYSELDTYVSSSVVKILVGNKVDKELARQVPTSEASAFAQRMNSIFIETSAKSDINVREAFVQVVEQILDTPELWVDKKGDGRVGGVQSTSGGNGGVPGGVQIVGLSDLREGEAQGQEAGGCGC
ncbi:hypothetical protein AX16_000691 [Volvariella volvacea WC 439]|nr:hypothetical protein AX16_000691 [Volvariella volvacea WC 439]